VAPWPDGLQAVRATGFTLLALTPDGDDLERFEAPASGRVALLLGSEGPGVGPRTRHLADAAVGIPMAPGVDSLNVAAASAVALHRLARR
jgi:tRNA G18 (ribose-2'-O)-methylase SpoU